MIFFLNYTEVPVFLGVDIVTSGAFFCLQVVIVRRM